MNRYPSAKRGEPGRLSVRNYRSGPENFTVASIRLYGDPPAWVRVLTWTLSGFTRRGEKLAVASDLPRCQENAHRHRPVPCQKPCGDAGTGFAPSLTEANMSTATLTRRDLELRDTVVLQLEWDPEVDAAAIGVAANGGAVTLSGFVDSYAGKLAAERAAKRVKGVRAVANELQVRLRIAHADDEIAKQAAATLATWKQPHPGVQATIHGGHVTLTGSVRWIFQKEWAEEALGLVPGVVAIVNRIEVLPAMAPDDVERRIPGPRGDVSDDQC
jgi:osmotically-inducible protein OsmY